MSAANPIVLQNAARTPVIRNLFFTLGGKVITALLSVASAALFYRFLGPAKYASIGWYLLAYSLISIIIGPFSTALVRQLSPSAASGVTKKQAARVAGLERKYQQITLLGSVALFVAAIFILKLRLIELDLGRENLYAVVALMSAAVLSQWAAAFYTGCFIGLQRHAALQGFTVTVGIVRLLASLAALAWCKQPLTAFFACQAALSMAQAALSHVWVWRQIRARMGSPDQASTADLPDGENELGNITAVSIILLAYNQWDKLLVGAFFSSRVFGVYSLIWQVLGGLYALYNPVFNVYFPLLSGSLVESDLVAARRHYRQAAQVIAAVVAPPTIVITMYAKDVLWLFTRDQRVAVEFFPILMCLMPSAMFSAWGFMPWSAQLATARTGAGVVRFFVTLLLLIGFQLTAALMHSLIGIACSYSIVTAVQTFWVARITHREILTGEGVGWYVNAILKPTALAVLTVGLLRAITWRLNITSQAGLLTELCWITTASMLILVACLPATSASLQRWCTTRVWTGRFV